MNYTMDADPGYIYSFISSNLHRNINVAGDKSNPNSIQRSGKYLIRINQQSFSKVHLKRYASFSKLFKRAKQGDY